MSLLEQLQGLIGKKVSLSRSIEGNGLINSATSKEAPPGASKDFDEYMKALLTVDPAGEVDEEEMFAALAQERVMSAKGEEGALKFSEVYKQKLEELRRPDGNYRIEDSARAALRELVTQNVLTADEGNSIYSSAFNAAQLDENKNVLFDGTGGANDPTRAVANLEAALLGARTMIEKVAKGDETIAQRILVMDPAIAAQIAPLEANGNEFDGAEGFLWKPISQNQQRLAVLLPKEHTYNVEKVILRDSAGNEIEQGVFSSFGEGGPNAREKFNFAKQGGEYPPDLVAEMWTKDGQVIRWKIPDPSQRYD